VCTAVWLLQSLGAVALLNNPYSYDTNVRCPQVASFDALKPLTSLSNLTCLYLEHNPLAKDFEYRMTVTKMLPSLQQLDATMVNRTIS
jgi:hypothetical protein